MDNIKLLDHCINNPETDLDKFYIFTEKNRALDKYVKKTKDIKNILISIKEVKKEKDNKKILKKLYKRLWKIIDNTYSIYSEFGCFINACDAGIDDVIVDFELFKKITDLYIQKRDLNEIVPSEWIQALLDKGASRKKGSKGEKKLISILEDKNYVLSNNFKDFISNKKSVAKFKKKGDFSLSNLEEKLGESINKDDQDKILDLFIKSNKDFYFLEAKHLHVSGGAQNKQILELINIIKKSPIKDRHHFVSFLDGRYFDFLFGDDNKTKITEEKQDKISTQKKDIKKALKSNKNNFFTNTAGFEKLF